MKNKPKGAVLVIALALALLTGQFVKALSYEDLKMAQGAVLGDSTLYPYPTGSVVSDGGTIYFISGTTKVPFTNYKAFTGLGFSTKNMVKGDLSNYTLSKSYVISTANTQHPWGGWLSYKNTVYYNDASGLIGVPGSSIFLSNGGLWKNLVKANKYDVAVLNKNSHLPLLTMNDSRVAGQQQALQFSNTSASQNNPLQSGSQSNTAPTPTPTPTPAISTTTISSSIPIVTMDTTVGGLGNSQTINLINNSRSSGVTWTMATSSASSTWLSAYPTSGIIEAGGMQSLSIVANTSGLNLGSNSDSITINYSYPTGESGSTNIPVTVNISNSTNLANLSLSQNVLNLYYTLGGTAPTATSVLLTNLSSNTFATYSQSMSSQPTWLNCTYPVPSAILNPNQSKEICAQVDPSKLTVAQTYSAIVSITGHFANSPLNLTINLNVIAPQAFLNQNSVSLSAITGSVSTPPQTVNLSFAPTGSVGWTTNITYNSGADWLTVTNNSGQAGNSTLGFTVNANVLAPGNYSATITISSSASPAQFSPITLPVQLTVLPVN